MRWFLSSNLNEIQSAPYIHAHASWSQGQSAQQIDFPVHWTPLKKAAENKSPTIYNGCTPESNQSVGSLPTASLLSSLPSSAPYHLIAKPCWILTCRRLNPAWLCGKWFNSRFTHPQQKIMIWLGFKFSIKPVWLAPCAAESMPYVLRGKKQFTTARMLPQYHTVYLKNNYNEICFTFYSWLWFRTFI